VAKFELEQVASILAVQQLINEWGSELDVNEGLNMGPLVTEDCRYTVRGVERQGRDEVVKFYKARLAEFEATPAGTPTQRHVLSNMRISFKNADEARIDFLLTYYLGFSKPPVTTTATPVAVADVWMDVRRDADGHWRIASFDSVQTFRHMPG
jgi:uncharacterized protein (TIGR02246 family)